MNHTLPLAQLQRLYHQLSSLQQNEPTHQKQLQQAVQFFIDEIFSLPYGRFLHLDGPVLRQQFAYLDTLHQQLEQGHLQLSLPANWQLVLGQMQLVLEGVISAEAEHRSQQ
ncbi:hypothetical protein K3G63_03335 [Hymenobacter sp. HSC-4F20]|uniref:hypothetical protein n=1 Tax=Hymenobacter sp. HSC-4F20 TaxID=2864135 RepID=UPI001C7326E1|nr:hypothetical protein [Hymenobacter sp. HSC-4F20]MBX0289452.1 hypothetical protein [Hymenobacter sp. HSC-4F20]